MIDSAMPLSYCDSLPNLGGFLRCRIAYSKDIIQQEYQTDSEISAVVFLAEHENWIADWRYKDRFEGDLKIESNLTDVGVADRYSFKAILEIDCDPMEFNRWHNRKIRNRRLVLELTNNNNYRRVINPFIMTYSYIGTSEMGILNRYELLFTRDRMVDNLRLLVNSIKEVQIDCHAVLPPENPIPKKPIIFYTITEYYSNAGAFDSGFSDGFLNQ